MRNVFASCLGRAVSALGFGCAPLGSLVSEAQGLRALSVAFERGVTWYDAAPHYGDGEAEEILGKFLAGRRDRVTLCTQFGVPRPVVSPAMRLMRPLARAFARAVPMFQGTAAARHAPRRDRLYPEQIESSLVESLRRLRTDCVDVLALHEPRPEDCASEAVLHELQRLIDKGYTRCIAIAGAAESIVAGARASGIYKIGQLRESPFAPGRARVEDALSGGTPLFFVTYGIFDSYDLLSRLLIGDGGRLGSLASQLGYGPPFMASEMLLDHAFAANPDGVVLASMFTQAHIDMNCARASRPPRKDIGPFMQKFVIPAAG
ncbi:MAG TPA: aldo/keto reductase [Methylocella sp.]|nr:aldo/keto reductase [Methylocella sp.]